MKITLERNVVYLDGVPAFALMADGHKEPVNPNGWGTYRNHEIEVEYWLERRKRPAQSPSGQLG